MSEDRLKDASHNLDSGMNAAFEQWDAGTPADNWEALDEALSVEKVWSRLGASILASEHAPDAWISESHKDWNPEMSADGWERLNDSVSLEQVWQELNTSLSVPVSTRMPFIKLLAATVAMLFAVSTLNDSPVVFRPFDTNTTTSAVNQHYLRSVEHGIIDAPADAPATTESLNPENNPANNTNPVIVGGTDPQDLLTANRSLPENVQQPVSPENAVVQLVIPQETDEEDLAVVDPLERKALNTTISPLMAGNWKRKERFSPWTLQMGTQLSILEEADQSRLTTVVPQFGMAADVSFRHRLGPVQLIHAIGLSQYSQDAGKYVNGRYRNTQQRINTLQWSSALGYNYRRFTVYGGVLFSKMLTGLEQNQSKVTKVYDFSTIQLGATGGIDMRVISFPLSGKAISVGAQYQWIPNLQGKNQSFENIHGIRLQAKFSF